MSTKQGITRSASGTLQRKMTNQGKIYLSSESKENLPATGVCVVIDGIITIKSLSKVLNTKLIPHYDRFKSIATSDGYYKHIDNFDCSRVLSHYKIDEKELSKHKINTDTSKLQIIEQYIAIHHTKYHNHLFTKRHQLPLWRGHLLTFDALHLSVFYLKAHHCICDGITMGDIFLSLSDNYQVVINEMKRKRDGLTIYKQYKQRQHKIKTSWCSYIEWSLYLFWLLLKFIWFALTTSLCRREPESILKPVKTSVHKSFAVLLDELELKNINAQRHRYVHQNDIKITFNDYMMTIIAEGLNNWLSQIKKKQKIDIPDEIAALIPVNTRDPLSGEIQFGNNVGLLNVFIPFNLKSTKKVAAFERRLCRIKLQMDNIKENMFAKMSSYVLRLLGYLPKWISGIFLNQVASTVVISNIAGPNRKLVFCGEDIITCFGVIPITNSISLSFGVVTYNGKVSVSCYADNNINGADTAKNILKCIQDVLIARKCMP